MTSIPLSFRYLAGALRYARVYSPVLDGTFEEPFTSTQKTDVKNYASFTEFFTYCSVIIRNVIRDQNSNSTFSRSIQKQIHRENPLINYLSSRTTPDNPPENIETNLQACTERPSKLSKFGSHPNCVSNFIFHHWKLVIKITYCRGACGSCVDRNYPFVTYLSL